MDILKGANVMHNRWSRVCVGCNPWRYGSSLELGDIIILLFIVILKCHDNQDQRKIFNIIISSTWYYCKCHDYHKIHCSETCASLKCFHLIFTILVAIVLLSDIMIILIIVVITLMIYRGMKFLLSPIPSHIFCKVQKALNSRINVLVHFYITTLSLLYTLRLQGGRGLQPQ